MPQTITYKSQQEKVVPRRGVPHRLLAIEQQAEAERVEDKGDHAEQQTVLLHPPLCWLAGVQREKFFIILRDVLR